MSKIRGKTICETLKQVRKQIAESGGIPYHPSECHHQGECRGTCPACEAEMKYLEQSLIHKFGNSYTQKIAGIAMITGALSLSSCGNPTASTSSDCSADQTMKHDNQAIVKDTTDCINMSITGEAPALNQDEIDSLANKSNK